MLERNIRPGTESDYRDALGRDFADLRIESIKVLASGWDRVAVLVNDDLVFRLPAKISGEPDPSDVKATQSEVALLRAVKEPPFSIPRPSYVSPDSRYFGYRLLEGNRWKEHSSLSAPTDSLVRSWVRARQAIAQSVSVDKAQELGVPYLPLDQDLVKAESVLSSASNEIVAKGVEDSIAYVRQNMYHETWQFTHNDLNAENILVDDTGDNIIGVLDFGDAHIAPVSSDYYLWDKWPHEVMERVALIASKENDHFDARLARAIHRVYVANDIADCRQAQDEEAEKSYWRELERVYSQSSRADGA